MAEKQESSSEYDRQHMMIPSATKVAIKIWFFNILDLGIVLLSIGLGIRISNLYTSLPLLKGVMAFLGFLVGIFLIIRTGAAPGMRNWRVLFFVLLQDKKGYYPIVLDNEKIEESPSKRYRHKKGDQSLINNKKARQKEEELRNILALGGPINCTDDGILFYEDSKVSRFLKLKSTDLFDLSSAELETWQDSLTNVTKTYLEDCSYFALPAKLNTNTNQRYWRYLRQKCNQSTAKDKHRARDITEQIGKAELVERQPEQYSSRIYYVELFADNEQEIQQRTRYYKLSALKLKPETLNRKETEELLFDLNNPNSN